MGGWRRFLVCLSAICLSAVTLLAVGCLPPGGWGMLAAAFLQNPRAAATLLQPSPEPAAETKAAWSPQPTATPTPAPTAQAVSEEPAKQQVSATPTPAPRATIPAELTGAAAIESQFYEQGSGEGYVTLEAGSIKNLTENSDAELEAIVDAAEGKLPFEIELDSSEPQVLILHTHATETYQTWDAPWYDPDFGARTQDASLNMCAVGTRMAEILNEAGINTLHDQTLHDSPSYTESYARSAQTARAYLEQYPSIKVILDVHRDAIEDGDTRIKPLCTIEGEDTAQVMIIAGCNNGSTVRLPNWRMNLQFAAAWESEMETLYPGLTRPVMCAHRFYNQDISTGSLLIEVGGHANTVQEAIRGGEYAARALAALLGGR